MQQSSPFESLLESTATSTIVPEKRTLIAFLAEQPIQQVITALSQHHILSAPVVKSTEHTILGSVDVLQIADYLTVHHGEEKSPISKVIAHSAASSHEPMTPFFSSNPLSLLVDLFASGIHRVALFPDSHELVSTVSQSDVINWMSKNLEKSDAIKTFVNQSIQQLFTRDTKPVSVAEETSVRDTIKTMMSSHVSSVAIVDKTGRLTGSFSPSDLRGLVDINNLSQPIAAYAKKHATQPIIVGADETLAHVISTMAGKRQHRVWVVSASGAPVSIISTTDIMRVIGSGATITARQANADVDPTKLWIAPMQTIKVNMAMLSSDSDAGTGTKNIQVEASTQTQIGGTGTGTAAHI